MELLLKTFSLSEEEFESYNKKTTEHVKSYFDHSINKLFRDSYDYLAILEYGLSEYCEFGADKCYINNFKEFCYCYRMGCNNTCGLQYCGTCYDTCYDTCRCTSYWLLVIGYWL